jgi:hypothetical protein
MACKKFLVVSRNTALTTFTITLMFSSVIWAQTEKVLWNFSGAGDGISPNGLIFNAAGNLYMSSA